MKKWNKYMILMVCFIALAMPVYASSQAFIKLYEDKSFWCRFTGDCDDVLILESDFSDFTTTYNETYDDHILDYAYGEMWYMNHTGTPVNFSVDGTYYPTFFTNSTRLKNFTFNGGFGINSNLTAEIGGTYKVGFMAAGTGQNNHIYFTTVFVNEVRQNQCMAHEKASAGGDIITQTGVCFIDLIVGDNVTLRTNDYGDTGTGNYHAGNLNLLRIGD